MRTPGTDLGVESETQWKITWFPPDRSDVVRTGSEAQIRKQAVLQADWFPIVEKREIVVGPWEQVDLTAPPEETAKSCRCHHDAPAPGAPTMCPVHGMGS